MKRVLTTVLLILACVLCAADECKREGRGGGEPALPDPRHPVCVGNWRRCVGRALRALRRRGVGADADCGSGRWDPLGPGVGFLWDRESGSDGHEEAGVTVGVNWYWGAAAQQTGLSRR